MLEVPERVVAKGKMEEVIVYMGQWVKDPEGFEEGIKKTVYPSRKNDQRYHRA